MNSGRYILTQVLDLIHRQALDRLIKRYDIRTRHFGCRQQLICMGFAQLAWREFDLSSKKRRGLFVC